MNSRRRNAIEGGAEGAPLTSRRRNAIEGGAEGAPLTSRRRDAIEGGAEGARAHGDAHQHDLRYLTGGAQPEVFATAAGLTFAVPATQAGVEAAVREFLRRLSPALAAAGCVLVGHIKGVVATDSDELELSLTRLHGEPRFGGVLRGEVRQADLTLNVIVFGVDPDALPGVVTGAWPGRVAAVAWRARSI